ncbi:MAG TPA: O-antigen ligase family protein [Nitrospiraceae bacterium]|jgi:O-antigen ligase|nr:O-antigen ligase family protein [Nitrospiraceae bacterium]
MIGRSFTPSPPLEMLLPLLLAVPLALVIVVVKPTVTLGIVLGVVLVAMTFVAPLAGLYVLVFSMLLGPEVLMGGMGSGTTLGRGVTLRLDDFLLVLVGLAWLAKVALSPQKVPFTKTILNKPIMLYVAACVLATLIGVLTQRVRPSGGFFFLLKYYEYFFLYFMTINLVTTQKQIRSLVICSLVTCFLVSLYALSQIPSGVRVSAPFEGADGEPNTLGGYLVFMMAIMTGFLITPQSVSKKLPLVGLMVLAGIALQATLSRASFLAAGVMALVILIFVSRRSPFLLALVLSTIVAAPFWMPTSVTQRVMYTFFQPKEEGQIQVGRLHVDTSTSDRLRSWQQSLEFFRRSPIWGMGVTGGPFMDATYPRVLIETGLLGIVAFVALLWMVFRTSMTGYLHTTDPYVRGMTLGFLFGFLGLLIHAIGSNTFIIVRIMEPFWLYAALVVKGYLLDQQKQQDGTTPPQLEGVPVDRFPIPMPGQSVSRARGARLPVGAERSSPL